MPRLHAKQHMVEKKYIIIVWKLSAIHIDFFVQSRNIEPPGDWCNGNFNANPVILRPKSNALVAADDLSRQF